MAEIIEDPELQSRFKAQQLKNKQNLTLAEKLILASNEDKFTFSYKGIPIEVWSPTQHDFANFVDLYNQTLTAGEQNLNPEETKEIEEELNKVVADLCIDDSITPELLNSGELGISFIPKLMKEIQEYNKKEVEEVTQQKGFRRK